MKHSSHDVATLGSHGRGSAEPRSAITSLTSQGELHEAESHSAKLRRPGTASGGAAGGVCTGV